jgi:molecular chaperone DnaK (HSP70)
MTMRIGIDFGTCYSSAALMLNGALKPVKEPSKQGSSFPSSIFVKQDEDKIFVGEAAERQRRLDPECYWREFKRDLGRTEPSKLGNRQILPEEAISEIIRTLKTEAERMVTEPLTGAVITVPANYQSYKQQLMEQAAKQAGFSDVEIITEPVAAAIYHARKGGGERTMKDGDIILVYDLGGGTFDAALIQKRGGGFELLAQPVGDEQCGGIDFDRQIYADLKGRCSETFRELLDLKRQDVSALRTRLMVGDWCREFKHQLSAVSHYEDVLMLGAIEETYSLSRIDFEGKIEPFISRTCQLSSQLVTEAGIKWEQVSQVLMVGGSCRIPYVRQRLEREFDRPVVQVDEPDLAVCLGAVIYANEQIEQQRLEAEIKVKADRDLLKRQLFALEKLEADLNLPQIYKDNLIHKNIK